MPISCARQERTSVSTQRRNCGQSSARSRCTTTTSVSASASTRRLSHLLSSRLIRTREGAPARTQCRPARRPRGSRRPAPAAAPARSAPSIPPAGLRARQRVLALRARQQQLLAPQCCVPPLTLSKKTRARRSSGAGSSRFSCTVASVDASQIQNQTHTTAERKWTHT